MSRDTRLSEPGDRRLWLADSCPACGAQAGARCQSRSGAGRRAGWSLALHAARGWRQRPCPTCHAKAGERCATLQGRPAVRPHAARLDPGRRELHTGEAVWRALERVGAQVALVRFSGGGGRAGTLESVSVQAGARERAHRSWRADRELTGALAAPAWSRFGTFRGHPVIAATLVWNVAERSLLLTGTRGGQTVEETFQQPMAGSAGRPERLCCRCAEPIAPSARPEARYCSKLCRQAASRARLRAQAVRPIPAERCAWCHGPMPGGLRVEACWCSKRCRQAASRARLRHAPGP